MPELHHSRLVIQRKDGADGYTACWVETDGVESDTFDLELPLTSDDTDDLRWYLEEYLQFNGAGNRARAQGIETKLKGWGDKFFKAAFAGDQGTHVYRNLVDAVRDKRPCMVTLGTEDRAVLSLPWEMMRDSKGPLTFQGITIRRQLTGARPITHHTLRLPLRVLLIVSRPTDVGFIDPRNSIPPVLDALDALGDRVRVDFCDPPTLPQLEETISRARRDGEPFHIVHFDGHGTYLPKTGVGALCFENDEALNTLVTGAQLGDLMARLEVPLVLLEACRGADLSDRPVFGSLAPALLESGVGSVIAFSHSVHIEAARILVERFYRELAAGFTVGQALEEARSALRAKPARWLHRGPNADSIDLEDWFIPQLYQVGEDPALVTDDGTPVKPAPKRPGKRVALPGFPPEPMYKFHGRARELLDIERAFRRHRAVVLSGMGGMGKTALAREAAAWWRRTGRFDHTVFCSFEQKAGAERVVQLIGQALEGDAFSSRSGDDQWQTAVDLFHEQKVLVVWDNFESTLPQYQQGEKPDDAEGAVTPVTFGEDARSQLLKLYSDLVADEPEGRLLVTCRPADTGLPGIKEQPLEGLARPDSLHLLAAALDVKGVSTDREGYEREQIDALLDALADHPLSIELVAPHLKDLKPTDICADFGKLVKKFENAGAFEARNKSLLASLEFSKKRLSQQAQDVLPYLAWFEGGVFENVLLGFTELEAEAWAAVRAELVATALVSVENLPWSSTPYLRFHPTLPFAAQAADVPDPEASETRFIGVYLAAMQMANKALGGSEPAAGMALMALEEANFRAAMNHAFRRGDRLEGTFIADTLGAYLQMSGRLRERDALTEWVHGQTKAEDLDQAACAATLEHGWTLFTQGRAQEAIAMIQGLITRIESEGLADGKDPAFHLAVSNDYLGRILLNAGLSAQALAPLNRAIEGFERLGDDQRGNLATALGDRANSYRNLAQFDEALEDAERALALNRDLGWDHGIATSLGRIARIFMAQGRYAEADARYTEALEAAEAAGDLELQGTILQHQGGLQDDMGNYDRGVDRYQQAIAMFQRANDTGGEMQTCDLLGTAEKNRGHLDAAEAWYQRSRELAEQLGDRRQLAIVAQNVGILYKRRAEEASDAAAREAFLRRAVESIEESLRIKLEMDNQVGAAASHSQLGVLHRELGELDQAERHAREALKIRESLSLPEVYKVYGNLALIARDRGDAEAAAEWQAKYDAKVAEVKRLAHGEGAEGQAPGVPPELVKGILALSQAAYAARQSGSPLPPDAAEALAQIAEWPGPLNAIAPFLDDLAAGKPIAPIPSGLPDELGKVLQALLDAVGE